MLGALWARGYFAASSGNVTDEVIAQYIGLQTHPERDRDDDFTVDSWVDFSFSEKASLMHKIEFAANFSKVYF